MFKILHSADWHILLHKKKVPWQWQWNRFQDFFSCLLDLEKDCDVHVIAGDVFDKKPEPDEVALFLSYIHRVKRKTFIIPGNHEATSRGETFLKHFIGEYRINNPLVEVICYNAQRSVDKAHFQFFPYGEMQRDNLPQPIPGHILVTHIRGEVPPHITAEYDFERLRPWKLVLCGDLHHNHRYRDMPLYYSGSPMNVSFDRSEDREYGVNIVEGSLDNYKVRFVPLDLPRLIRKTISSKSEMVASERDHVIYEIVGSIDELAQVEKTDLLDKKIAYKADEQSVLDLSGLSLVEELELYLRHQKIEEVDTVLSTFKSLGVVR